MAVDMHQYGFVYLIIYNQWAYRVPHPIYVQTKLATHMGLHWDGSTLCQGIQLIIYGTQQVCPMIYSTNEGVAVARTHQASQNSA